MRITLITAADTKPPIEAPPIPKVGDAPVQAEIDVDRENKLD